jgi:hypothetical protein
MSLGYELWVLMLALVAGLACGFLNTAASSGSAVSLPILMMIGLDPLSANATNRIPVLIGALSATASFQRSKALPWGLALKISLPVAIGGLAGAVLAELVPSRNLGLVITAAVLVALVLLFTKLKQALASAVPGPVRYGTREFLLFAGIGVWLGFIVLDGATYLLLALTLVVRAAVDRPVDAAFGLGRSGPAAVAHAAAGTARGRARHAADGGESPAPRADGAAGRGGPDSATMSSRDQRASGLILSRHPAGSRVGKATRSPPWKRLRPVTQACRPASAPSSGSTFRTRQQPSGSRRCRSPSGSCRLEGFGIRPNRAHVLEPKLGDQPVAIGEGLGKQLAGLEKDDRHMPIDARHHVQQHRRFRPERRHDRQPAGKHARAAWARAALGRRGGRSGG